MNVALPNACVRASVIRQSNVHRASGTEVISSILAIRPACQNTLCAAQLSYSSEGKHCTSNNCNPHRSCKSAGLLRGTMHCLTSTPQRTTAINHLALIVLVFVCFSWTAGPSLAIHLGSRRQTVDLNSSRSICKHECKSHWLDCTATSSHKQSNRFVAEGLVVHVPLFCCCPCFDMPRWHILPCSCAFVRLKIACPIDLCVFLRNLADVNNTKSHRRHKEQILQMRTAQKVTGGIKNKYSRCEQHKK